MKLPFIAPRSDPPKRRSSVSPRKDNRPDFTRDYTFQRNRTLTGSISTNIRTSNELQADMLSPRAHVHHLAKHRSRLFRNFFIVIVTCVVLYILLSQMIANVSIASTTAHLRQPVALQYQKSIDQYFMGHPMERLFPLRDEKNLTLFVQQTHPEVLGISLQQTAGFGNVQASLSFRRPVAKWSIKSTSEYVDQSGIVFSNNLFSDPSLTIVDASNLSSDSSSSGLVASHRFLVFVGQVVGQMKANGLTVTKATIPLLTTRQLEVTAKEIPYPIKLSIDRGVGVQVEDAVRVINYQKQNSIDMKYIDVRIKGKAFYK